MIIDDEQDIVELIKVIKTSGSDVITFSYTKDACAELKKGNIPDLV